MGDCFGGGFAAGMGDVVSPLHGISPDRPGAEPGTSPKASASQPVLATPAGPLRVVFPRVLRLIVLVRPTPLPLPPAVILLSPPRPAMRAHPRGPPWIITLRGSESLRFLRTSCKRNRSWIHGGELVPADVPLGLRA